MGRRKIVGMEGTEDRSGEGEVVEEKNCRDDKLWKGQDSEGKRE